MHPFALSRADDAAQAIVAHSQDPHLAFIAGGTDLIGLIKDRATLPERLLDINHLPGLARIEARPDGGLHIGALAHMSDVAAHIEVRRLGKKSATNAAGASYVLARGSSQIGRSALSH